MNKIIVFRGRNAAPGFGATRPIRLTANWRRNPASGRLECRWQAEGAGAPHSTFARFG